MNPNFLPTEFVLPLKWEDARQIFVDRETHTADVINNTESGFYDSLEVLNGQQFFSSINYQQPRLAFRKIIDLGSLPNTGTLSIAHGITGITVMTRIYGAATSATSYIPMPYFGLGNGIELQMDLTNIIVTTYSNRSAYTGLVVVEYLKN
jgi:hypothetical protein